MNTFLKNTSILCLVSVTAFATSLRGDQKAAPSSSTKEQPAGLAAKVLKVDQAKKLLTVEAKGKTITYNLSPDAKITQNGKTMTLADLTNGQQINLITKPTVKGELQIVSLTVGSGVTANGVEPTAAPVPAPTAPKPPKKSRKT